jgi:hypothetical protein
MTIFFFEYIDSVSKSKIITEPEPCDEKCIAWYIFKMGICFLKIYRLVIYLSSSVSAFVIPLREYSVKPVG